MMLLRLLVSLFVASCYLFNLNGMKTVTMPQLSHLAIGHPSCAQAKNSEGQNSNPLQGNNFEEKTLILSSDDSTFIDEIIAGKAKIRVGAKEYPVCTNTRLRDTIQKEKLSGCYRVTNLLLKKRKYCMSKNFSGRVYNVHFISRLNGDKEEIDIWPTARTR